MNRNECKALPVASVAWPVAIAPAPVERVRLPNDIDGASTAAGEAFTEGHSA